ncbi:MAG TPA: O-antigen ligase family protein [Chitinophagaceae bacterium]|nr:O-antigen ligase family protein [Chitinophagaceae bacterium]
MKTVVTNRTNLLFGLFAGLFLLALVAAFLLDSYYVLAIPFGALLLNAGWRNPSLVFYGLLFSLPLSFEYSFSATLGTDIPDELLMLLTAGLFLIYGIYNRQAISREIKTHPLIFLLTILCGWMLVAILFSTHPLISVKYGLAKTWYLGAFVLAPLLVFTNKASIRTAALLLAGSMLLITLIALVGHGLTGFSFASVNEAVSPFFRNHVNYSAMLVCLLPVWFAFYHLTKNKVHRWFILAVIGLSLAALFFSYARGAWLALLAGGIAFLLIRKRKLVTAYLLFILLAIAAVFWLRHQNIYLRFAHNYQRTIFHKDFGEHLVATYKLKDVSTAERFYRWIAGVRMIKDQPLTGFGPNTFYENYKPYGVPAFKTWVSDNPEHSTVHNYFLLTVIEQGYPGLFFFLLLLGAMLWYAQHLWHRTMDPFYKTTSMVTGVMLVMIITVNCLSDLIETDKVGSLFFLCLSLLITVDLQTRKNKTVDAP